jgi:hypothetical protein
MELPVDDTVDEALDEEPFGIIDNDKTKNAGSTTNPTWNGPPSPPDPEIVTKDRSCHGTIAVALQTALIELQQHEALKSIEQQYNFQLDINKVMQAFGESIVQNHQELYAQQTQQTKQQLHDNTPPPSTTTCKNIVAPAALLRGKIQHYNRYGTKWRFVVKDAEIIPRIPFNHQHHQRSKRQRTSLYEMTESALLQQKQQQTEKRSSSSPPPPSSSSSVSIKIPQLEILVYNDIE